MERRRRECVLTFSLEPGQCFDSTRVSPGRVALEVGRREGARPLWLRRSLPSFDLASQRVLRELAGRGFLPNLVEGRGRFAREPELVQQHSAQSKSSQWRARIVGIVAQELAQQLDGARRLTRGARCIDLG
jgi:hypothetical protein